MIALEPMIALRSLYPLGLNDPGALPARSTGTIESQGGIDQECSRE